MDVQRRYLSLKAAALPVAFFLPLLIQWQPSRGPTFKTTVDVVDVSCTVQDRDNRYASHLAKEDFELFEDGERQEIRYFSHSSAKSAPPLNMVLLVDASISVKDKLQLEMRAADEFIQAALRDKDDSAAVVSFNSTVNLIQGFTSDRLLLKRALLDIRVGGATCLYDGIWLSIQDLLVRRTGRSILVVLSDGADTGSNLGSAEAQRIAEREEVTIYSIGVESDYYQANLSSLQRISENSGGLFFRSEVDLNRLRSVFLDINRAIANQYNLGYIPVNPNRTGRFREISVRLKQPGLKVTHRKGYYEY